MLMHWVPSIICYVLLKKKASYLSGPRPCHHQCKTTHLTNLVGEGVENQHEMLLSCKWHDQYWKHSSPTWVLVLETQQVYNRIFIYSAITWSVLLVISPSWAQRAIIQFLLFFLLTKSWRKACASDTSIQTRALGLRCIKGFF